MKPDNVMVGRYGETLVVDWGMAKSVERPDGDWPEAPLSPSSASGSAETIPGSVIGTPAYMSPEQAEARVDLLGPASDVYSLGATLYALLTGHPPVGGKPLDALLADVRRGNLVRSVHSGYDDKTWLRRFAPIERLRRRPAFETLIFDVGFPADPFRSR